MNYKSSTHSIQGRRKYMEDTSTIIKNNTYIISAIFDGHGGKKCSVFFAKNFNNIFRKLYIKFKDYKLALLKSIEILNKLFLSKNIQDGTTANIIVVDKKNKRYYNLNIGDSRSLLGRKTTFRQISKDHKPTTPKERNLIKKNGGFVKDGRLNGILAMSRSLGDKKLVPNMHNEPDIYEGSTKSVKFFINASDGLFDVLSNKQVYDFIAKKLSNRIPIEKIAKSLVRLAYNNDSYDNITINIITLD